MLKNLKTVSILLLNTSLRIVIMTVFILKHDTYCYEFFDALIEFNIKKLKHLEKTPYLNRQTSLILSHALYISMYFLTLETILITVMKQNLIVKISDFISFRGLVWEFKEH